MRATISFEADVDQVNVLMGALVKQEAERLRDVAHLLSVGKDQEHKVGEKISTGLEMVQKIAHQLSQYKDMLESFERSKFETILPQAAAQPVANLGDAVANLNKFGNFIDRLNDSASEATSGEENDIPSQEG